jgi:hypothetical protein
LQIDVKVVSKKNQEARRNKRFTVANENIKQFVKNRCNLQSYLPNLVQRCIALNPMYKVRYCNSMETNLVILSQSSISRKLKKIKIKKITMIPRRMQQGKKKNPVFIRMLEDFTIKIIYFLTRHILLLTREEIMGIPVRTKRDILLSGK